MKVMRLLASRTGRLLGAESTPGPWCCRKEICHWKIQWNHRESILSGIIFPWRSTQPLVKMSTRNIPGGKGGRCMGLTTLPPSCAVSHGNLGA